MAQFFFNLEMRRRGHGHGVFPLNESGVEICLRGMITCTVEIRVRYSETDAMGVVYHANYLPWFEVARTALLSQIGLPYRELEAHGHLVPVIEASLTYRAPARYDDLVSVTATIDEEPRARIQLRYEVRRGTELLTTGRTSHVFMTREGRAEVPPAEARAAFSKAFAAARSGPAG